MYDKVKMIDKIYEIAKNKKLKIGDMEEKAGVSRGYLSRINKSDKSTSPSIEVLASIAQQLGVTIDYLVNDWGDGLTQTEDMVIDFVDRLKFNTTEGKQEWVCESAAVATGENDTPSNNPLVIVKECYTEEFEKFYYDHVYQSRFYGDGDVRVDGNCYYTEINNGAYNVYLNCVGYQNPSGWPEDENEDTELLLRSGRNVFWKNHIIEIYIVGRNKEIRSVCSTMYLKPEVRKAVDGLYDFIERRESRVGVDRETKRIMQNFIKGFDF